jgi:hypothetical protein
MYRVGDERAWLEGVGDEFAGVLRKVMLGWLRRDAGAAPQSERAVLQGPFPAQHSTSSIQRHFISVCETRQMCLEKLDGLDH